nr:isocitrate lyase/PEP mutase family protein [Thermoproteota archaeon]
MYNKTRLSLRDQIEDRNKIIVLPGVFDALSAKIAEYVGFEAMFQTGYGSSAALLGMPDFGLLNSGETVDNAMRIIRAVRVPVLVDADTGYGNPLNVWRLVRDLERLGAAGIFLEDQVWPKRCGH